MITFQNGSVIGEGFQMATAEGGTTYQKLESMTDERGASYHKLLRTLMHGSLRGYVWDVEYLSEDTFRIVNVRREKQ